jgi:hypothetical protein
MKGRDNLKSLGIDERRVFREVVWGGVNWIHQAQDRGQ